MREASRTQFVWDHVYARFRTWHEEGKMHRSYEYAYGGFHLMYLLGYQARVGHAAGSEDPMKPYHEKHLGLAEALAGPHGYTIYKMLLIKKGLVDDQS